MKKVSIVLGGAIVAVLAGCAAAPYMRMSVPEGSSEYNGIKVFMHSIEQGDVNVAVDSSSATATENNLAELVVDSMPNLEYHIGPLDQVQIVVWEHPELTSPMGQYQPAGQKVTTDGTLFYPYAGELKVAGLTAQELRTEITKRLSNKILNDPQVDVRVTGYNSLKAFVSGEVEKPGFVSFDENPMTIPVALAAAGGFTEDADLSLVQLRRGDKVYNIDFTSIFKSNVPMDKILLQPNDQLYVASKIETERDSRVYVMGEVQKTGVVNMVQKKLSLVEALATAGGLQAVNASSKSIYVIRNTSEKQIDIFQLNAKNAVALAMADKFQLNSHDIVYVDASDLATWNRLIGQILPSVQTVYYGVLTARNVQVISNDGWGDAK